MLNEIFDEDDTKNVLIYPSISTQKKNSILNPKLSFHKKKFWNQVSQCGF